MDKKLTRRVVLGTAVAGLVVAPFVIRSFRRNNSLISAYEKWWYSRLAQTKTKIVHEGGPASFKIVRKVPNNASYRLLSLGAVYSEIGPFDRVFTELPSTYLFVRGKYDTSHERGGVALHGHFDEISTVAPGGDDPLFMPGSCTLLYDEHLLIGGKDQREGSEPLQRTLRNLIWLYVPLKEEYQIGERWTVDDPSLSFAGVPWLCEFKGYANVGGISTVLIQCEAHSDSQALMKYHEEMMLTEAKKDPENSPQDIKDIEEKVKHQVNEMQEERNIVLKTYLDLETGLVVRSEGLSDTKFADDPDRNSYTCHIVQISRNA